MKNLKVSVKLIVSFAIVIVLAAVVGGIGILGMYNINVADDALYNGNYLPSVLAGDISQQVVEQRTHARSIVLYDVELDAQAFQQAITDMEANRAEMEDMLAEYKLSISNPLDQQAYDTMVAEYHDQWLPALDEIITFGTANQNEEAKAALVAAGPIALDLDQLTADLQQVNMDDGLTAVNANTSLFVTMTIVEIIVLVASIAIAVFLAVYLARLIATPLSILTAFMNRAGSSGDLTLGSQDMENIGVYSKMRDEIGQCIASTAEFIQHIIYVAEELEMVSGGDLTHDVKVLSEKDTMGVSLKSMLASFNNSFTQIQIATSQVSQGSQQIADGAQSLAQGSTEQAATVEELSASANEIAVKTKANADMADNAAKMAGTIRKNAEKGSAQMNEMMAAVNEINQASQSISRVIKVIDDIAFQTNILALNAAVEAARAGQHGKGFAVVSEEVRNLAAKSAEAAKDTGSLIQNSIEKAELGARIAKDTAASLDEIVAGINENGQIIGQIAQSSEEQSVGVGQINTGIDQVTQVVQQNSATAEESAAASEELSGQAALLERLMRQFKLKGGESRTHAGVSAETAYDGGMSESDHPDVRAFTLGRSGDKY